jgi:hypothetical protein
MNACTAFNSRKQFPEVFVAVAEWIRHLQFSYHSNFSSQQATDQGYRLPTLHAFCQQQLQSSHKCLSQRPALKARMPFTRPWFFFHRISSQLAGWNQGSHAFDAARDFSRHTTIPSDDELPQTHTRMTTCIRVCTCKYLQGQIQHQLVSAIN